MKSKTLIEFKDEQKQALEKICQQSHISRAEAVRRAVDYYASQIFQDNNLDSYYGLWQNYNIHSLTYQKKLRDEWEKPAPQKKAKIK